MLPHAFNHVRARVVDRVDEVPLMVNRKVGKRRRDGKGGDAPIRGSHIAVNLRAWQNMSLNERNERFSRLVADVDEERLLRR